MVDNNTKELMKRVNGQEAAIINMARNLAHTILDGIELARSNKASGYQIVRDVTPLLHEVGNLGHVADSQIEAHNRMGKLAHTLGVKTPEVGLTNDGDGTGQDGPGRGKD